MHGHSVRGRVNLFLADGQRAAPQPEQIQHVVRCLGMMKKGNESMSSLVLTVAVPTANFTWAPPTSYHGPGVVSQGLCFFCVPK